MLAPKREGAAHITAPVLAMFGGGGVGSLKHGTLVIMTVVVTVLVKLLLLMFEGWV